jgi:hypothetical protein
MIGCRLWTWHDSVTNALVSRVPVRAFESAVIQIRGYCSETTIPLLCSDWGSNLKWDGSHINCKDIEAVWQPSHAVDGHMLMLSFLPLPQHLSILGITAGQQMIPLCNGWGSNLPWHGSHFNFKHLQGILHHWCAQWMGIWFYHPVITNVLMLAQILEVRCNLGHYLAPNNTSGQWLRL